MTNLKKRHRKDKNFKYFGLGAIYMSFLFLLFLLYTIISTGAGGFMQKQIRLNIPFDESGNYSKMIRDALDKEFPPEIEKSELYRLVTPDAKYILEEMKATTPQDVWLPLNDTDFSTKLTTESPQFAKNIHLRNHFNLNFFTNSDSQSPENAGIAGALIGTLFLLLSCMIIALPVGIMTAIYLEEFAPKNRFTDFLEININNLAAVPSIVFGLLGLAVYLNFFGLPRSAPLVGGMTLALMVIPIIIIATRASIKAVPPSIRQGAMALGASPLQVVMHHTLPLSLPGIMTGTILGIARAMGETAPLLMIGMVAFIADIPRKFTDPATAMPVQIYLWSKNNQPGFIEKTAAAIMVLLAILIVLNIIAVWIRRKYERRW